MSTTIGIFKEMVDTADNFFATYYADEQHDEESEPEPDNGDNEVEDPNVGTV